MERHLILSYILEFTTVGQKNLNNAHLTLKLWAKTWNFSMLTPPYMWMFLCIKRSPK